MSVWRGVDRSDADGPLFGHRGVSCDTGIRERHDNKSALVGGARCKTEDSVLLCGQTGGRAGGRV